MVDPSTEIDFDRDILPEFRHQDGRGIAVLITSEYEGLFRNGGIGTYYRELSEQFHAAGWTVLLLVSGCADRFGGRSPFAPVARLFSTAEIEEILRLKPPHHRLLESVSAHSLDRESLRALLFVQAVVRSCPAALVYVEIPEMTGLGYHTIQAKRQGMLAERCVTAVTLHGCQEWLSEAHERDTAEYLDWLWLASHYEQTSFELADLPFFISRFLRKRVEAYGWRVERSLPMENFVPLVNLAGAPLPLPGVPEVGTPVVFFGRLEDRKGLLVFVEALLRLGPEMRTRIHVLFMGKSMPLFAPHCRGMGAVQWIGQQLDGQISYSLHTNLTSDEAIRTIRGLQSPVVCLASHQENFPNAALEIGQLTVRMVVSDTGGFRETLEFIGRSDGVHWFRPRDPHALAAALTAALAGLPAICPPASDTLRTLNRQLLERKQAYITQAATALSGALAEAHPTVAVVVVAGPEMEACLDHLRAQSLPGLRVIVASEAFADVLRQAADCRWLLVLESGDRLVAGGLAQLLAAAEHSRADLLTCPVDCGGWLADFVGGSLPVLFRSDLRRMGRCLVSTARLAPYWEALSGTDAAHFCLEMLSLAAALGWRHLHHPYPRVAAPPCPAPADNPGLPVATQLRLRELLGTLPPEVWTPRQLRWLVSTLQQTIQLETVLKPRLWELEWRVEYFRKEAGESPGLRERIAAMESSKFWKMRSGWFKLKRRLGLPADGV